MNFDDIIGQMEVKHTLLNSLLRDRVGHAYIFNGPPGIGKRTVAAIFAGLLLCTDLREGKACGRCQACLLYGGGSNPDFRRTWTEETGIGVDEIREIQGDVAVRPMYSKRKVYIIENADKMTVQAQNCLLKTLEEPPSYVVIILTVSNYEAMLETIRSRSMRLTFKKYTDEQVRQAVRSSCAEVNAGMDFITAYAGGVIGAALELAGSEEFAVLREKTVDMLAKIRGAGLSEVLGFSSFFEENRDSIDLVLEMMAVYYRDLLVARETGNENMLINSDKKDIILINAEAYKPRRLLDHIGHIEAARRALKQNANYQLAIDNMLIKLQEDSFDGKGGWSKV